MGALDSPKQIVMLTVFSFKAVKLGEECLADEACLEEDTNALCVQGERLNAVCECKPEYNKLFDKSIGTLRCVPGKNPFHKFPVYSSE